MYEAFCPSMDQKFYASDFARLPEADRESFRGMLICTGCGQPAYFIRESKDGHAACFGSKSHRDSCDQTASSSEDSSSGELSDGASVANKPGVFVVVSTPPRPIIHVIDEPGASIRGTRAGSNAEDGNDRQSTTSIQTNMLLRKLIRDPDYSQSADVLQIGRESHTVAEHCVRGADIDSTFHEQRRMYWGKIVYAKAYKTSAWLSLGPKPAASIKLSLQTFADLLAELEISSAKSLNGSHFLFRGIAVRAASGQMVMKPKDLKWLTVRLAGADAGHEQ